MGLKAVTLGGFGLQKRGTGLGIESATPDLKVPLECLNLCNLLPAVPDWFVCSAGQEVRLGGQFTLSKCSYRLCSIFCWWGTGLGHALHAQIACPDPTSKTENEAFKFIYITSELRGHTYYLNVCEQTLA